MHVRSVHLRQYKRFTDLQILDLPQSVKLVVLAGPNGIGKSSLLDSFRAYHGIHEIGVHSDMSYHAKKGSPESPWENLVDVKFYEFAEFPHDRDIRRKLFYIRSAYRNEPEFRLNRLERVGPLYEHPKVARLIEDDRTVSMNYRTLVSNAIEGLFDGSRDDISVASLRDSIVGTIQQSLARIYPDLQLSSLGRPLDNGTFLFTKGNSLDFPYNNLSGGEKAVFDLILDICLKREYYDDTVYCIDEPESHLNARSQASLLDELLNLMPDGCQLWIASHSIGMLKRARDLKRLNSDSVIFLDFEGHNFDEPVILRPVVTDRSFWERVLKVALDDIASLVAPEQVVLCEGGLASSGTNNAEFDASCLRGIFSAEFPDTDFISVGSELDVRTDRIGIGRTIQTLSQGTNVIRLVDRDARSDAEVQELKASGVRVLSRRHLEAYLLDDEVLVALCNSVGKPEKATELLKTKPEELEASKLRDNPEDDLKSIGGRMQVRTRTILGLPRLGSNASAFMKDSLAPLLVGTQTYNELKDDIFGMN